MTLVAPRKIVSDGLRSAAPHEGYDPAAVVLHPHPLFGGDMHNHVVVALCEALADLGDDAAPELSRHRRE
jgi:alpha/beta superfamily hydrolase